MQVSTSIGADAKTNGDTDRPVFPVGHMVLFSLVTVLFFLWGMSNNLTDILVQQFKKSFELSPVSAQLVQTANFLGYFTRASLSRTAPPVPRPRAWPRAAPGPTP